jgi:hypothetical protein
MPRRPYQSEGQRSGERLIWALVPGTLLGKVDWGRVLGPHNLPSLQVHGPRVSGPARPEAAPRGSPINPLETQIS